MAPKVLTAGLLAAQSWRLMMPKSMKRLSITMAATALMFAATSVAFAQSEHEGHHPGGETAPASPAPQAQPDGTAPMQKEGMGMMGGKEMPMMKMMQEMHGKMMGGGMAMQPKGDSGPSSQALNGLIAKMNADLALPFSGNADVDFVKRMISHDQGAVDMAKVVLAFGKDAGVRKVAEDVIKTNEAEIATMQEWLKKQGQ
jgi:uncharacterized protein (DUF305 family)